MEELYCQSCGIPLDKQEVMGTNKDGSINKEYCIYCYKDGEFTSEMTMEEMIQVSLEHMREIFKDDPNYNEEEALKNMQSFFPELKRWKESK